jgi:hypothetical protein
MTTDDLSIGFFTLATQYYAAGRQAVHLHLMPVGANLLHHAVEMYLKAYLCRTLSIEVLKFKISHSLTAAWQEFKSQVSDTSLNRFDSDIGELDRFGNLRYPDISENVATMIWSAAPDRVQIHVHDRAGPNDQYKLYLFNIDDLVATIISKQGVNIAFFKAQLDSEAIETLTRDNHCGIWKK